MTARKPPMIRPKGLGRGLDALLAGTDDEAPAKDAMQSVAVDRLRPGKYQPRSRMDDASLDAITGTLTKAGASPKIVAHRLGELKTAGGKSVRIDFSLLTTYPVLFDARKEVSRSYDVGTMPLTVLVDREGVVRYVSEGYKPGYEQRYTDRLRELLNE